MASQNPTIKFIFSICLYCLISASSQNTLRSGENLNFTSQLYSANRLFYLGFYTPSENTNNTYLAIQFNTRDVRSYNSPVWIGNRENPVDRNSNPVLSVQSTGRIIITHTGGQPIPIYAAPGDESIQNISATLTDTGNFVVDSNGRVLWQSFDYPTDTLIPGMKLGFNRRTGRNWTISSWFSQDNPAPGPFTLEWDTIEGMLVIRRRGLIYWKSGELQDYDSEWGKLKVFTDVTSPPDVLNFNYNFTNVSNQDENYFTFSLFYDDGPPAVPKVITGWKLDYQGNVLNTHSRGAAIAMASLCYGYRNRDTFKGCQLWEQRSCRSNRETFAYRSFDFVGGQVDANSDGNTSFSLSDCRETCWRDCECFAFLYDTTNGCAYWRGNNFRVVQSLDGLSVQKYLLISSSNGTKKKNRTKIILSVVFSSLAVVVLCIGLSLLIMRKVKRGKRKEELHDLLRLDGYTENIELENSHDLRLFTYASIQSATSNFSSKMKLGQGGFGPVYKGKTREGQDIAVKVLSRQSGQGLVEFKTELILISKLQHVNLVKLIGCCIEGDEKMIVYDYMPNKSLDFFLFSPSKGEQLDWRQRFNIIEGIAQGLLYLHKHSRLRIVHRDLKPSNILLDKNMVPKISDFGLARIFKQDMYEVNTIRRGGTYGYMAPEYAMQGLFSVKSDVYSFGVLVLEIVSGRKNNSFDDIEGPLNLVEYAWELWSSDSSMELMDPSLKGTCTIPSQVQKCIHVALLCVENGADDRPTIEDIVSILKTDAADLATPKNPAFVTTKKREVKNVDIKLFTGSANELTISEMGGR